MSELTQRIITFATILLASVLLLIWHQPSALFVWADVVERWSRVIVRRMRVRAAALADANRVLRRSHEWHDRVMP